MDHPRSSSVIDVRNGYLLFMCCSRCLPSTKLLLEVLVGTLVVGVVLVLATVVLVVHLLGVAAGIALGTLAVNVVGALGLAELVDLRTREAGQELLGELVGDGLAWRVVSGDVDLGRMWSGLLTLIALVVLEHLHGGEATGTGEELMAELGLVVRLVDLLVVVTSFIWDVVSIQ